MKGSVPPPFRYTFTSQPIVYLQVFFSIAPSLPAGHTTPSASHPQLPSALGISQAVQAASLPLHGVWGGSISFDVVDVRWAQRPASGSGSGASVQVVFRVERDSVEVLSTTLLAADSNFWARTLFFLSSSTTNANSTAAAGAISTVRCTIANASPSLPRCLSNSNAWMESILH
ncbi:hypothetical protein CF319_g8943 [Tilletia indica]|nr:hypothetical protein CF319_g8943 [Tilletia indica]